MCSDQSYKHQNEHYYNCFIRFLFAKTHHLLRYITFCNFFLSHLLYTVCIARLSEGQSGQTVTCGQKVEMQITFSDSRFLAKFTTKLDANLIFQPKKTCSGKLTAGKSSSESSTLSIVLRELSDSQRLHLVIIHSKGGTRKIKMEI